MIWLYIFTAVLLGIIAGFGYYLVTKDSFGMSNEFNELVAALRDVKKKALYIGLFAGLLWPLGLVVVAVAVMTMAASGKSVEELESMASTDNYKNEDLDLTNHNIVLDEEPRETLQDTLMDEQATWIDMNALPEKEQKTEN